MNAIQLFLYFSRPLYRFHFRKSSQAPRVLGMVRTGIVFQHSRCEKKTHVAIKKEAYGSQRYRRQAACRGAVL
jgi:hypothetical protein